MIFNNKSRKFESYKERNLYYKFFAGYFFNELITNGEDTHESRIGKFDKLLKSGVFCLPENASLDHLTLNPADFHISFDNHLAQLKERGQKIKKGTDWGEFADILIETDNLIIGIEAKYHSNWKISKDIRENAIKLEEYKRQKEDRVGNKYEILQCLLVTEAKWKNSHIKTALSEEKLDHPFCVITWERLLGITDNEVVNSYLNGQLKLIPWRAGNNW